MKKNRVIAIKSPELRRIRDNFRTLWLAWGEKKENELVEAISQIGKNESAIQRSSGKLREQETSFIRLQLSELKNMESASICKCGVCGKQNKNMGYIPIEGEWYCIECYKQTKDLYGDSDEGLFYV